MMGMLAILLTWILAHIVFVGIGSMLTRGFGSSITSLEDYFRAFWAGWGCTLVLLQIWNFIFPVNDCFRIGLVAIGVGSYGLHIAQYRTAFNSRRFLILLLILIVVAIYLSNQALVPNPDADDGLYRLQVVRWVSEYPSVPGLGNLHSRLAFSNRYFLYPALYNTSFWLHRVSHVSSGILYLMLLASCGVSIHRLIFSRDERIYHFANALLFFIVLLEALGTGVYTISNDAATQLIGYILASYVWQWIDDLQHRPDKTNVYHLCLIVMLACIGVISKFSFAVFGLLMVGIAILAYLWHRRFEKVAVIVGFGVTVAVSSLIIIPMFIHSVIQTGYILYPITSFGGIATEWQIPAQQGASEMQWIASWGRNPHLPPEQVLNNMDWFPAWWRTLSGNTTLFRIPAALACFAIGLTFVVVFLQKFNRLPLSEYSAKTKALYLLTSLATILSLLFWFLTAPNLRFLGALPYIFGLSAIVVLLAYLPYAVWQRTIILFLAVAFMYLFVRNLLHNNWIQPHPEIGLYPQITAQTTYRTTDSGLGMYVADDSYCWSSALPCTPVFTPNLELREADNLRSGFIKSDS